MEDVKPEGTTQVSKSKTYPHDEEDVKHEQEIVEAIKKIALEQRFQFIALNNLTLQKKHQDTDLDHEMKDVVNKYNKLQEPLSQSTDQIITGRALTDSELEKVKEYLTGEELAKIAEANKQEVIPSYWATALKNCGPLNAAIEDHDRPIMEHLTQIDYKTEEENDNFTVVFHFSANEYFENAFLSVKFFMMNESEAEKSEATEIKWKEGKNITKKTISKKQKNKKTGKTREIKKEVDAESFFNFFKTLDIDKAGEEDADDEEGGDAVLEKLDLNLQIAQNIETELLPYHLEYYLGVREPSDDGDYDDMDEEDDDEGDDDSEEEAKPKKATKPKKKDSGDAKEGGEPKQECKQQ